MNQNPKLNQKLIALGIGAAMLLWGMSGILNYWDPIMLETDWYPDVPFQRGMSFTTWGNHGYNSTEARQQLDEMKAAGVEWVAYNPWWFQDYLNSTEIGPGPWSDSYENITDSFHYAHSIELRVLFKPMLNLEKVYDWRSFIEFSPEWMGNYTEWMVQNAIAAEEAGVEILSIGCEMGNMQIHDAEVREMISQIRDVYSGLLTYSANHDSFWYITWWDAVDIIGISMYSPMTTRFDPTLQELQNVWDGYYHKLEQFAAQWDKPISFTEIGAQALDGSNMIPNDNRISTEQDVEELRDIYLSLFNSRLWTAPWFKGTHWWIWDFFEPDPEQPERDIGFSPRIPLILETITTAYTSEREPVRSDILTRVLAPLSIALASFVLGIKSVGKQNSRSNEVKKPSEDENRKEFTKETNIPGNDPKINSYSLGLCIGVTLFLVTANYTIDMFSILASSFSYSVLLGISPIGLILTYLAVLIAALIAASLILRSTQENTLILLMVLLLGYPYAMLGGNKDLLLLNSFFTLLVIFLSVVAVLQHRKGMKGIALDLNKTILAALGSYLFLGAMSLWLGKTAQGVAILPIAFTLHFATQKQKEGKLQPKNEPQSLTNTERSAQSEEVKKKPKKLILIMLLTLGIPLGILIPIGNADYNLMSMNLLPLMLSIYPTFIGAFLVWLALQLSKEKKAASLDQLTNLRALLLGMLLLALFGILLTIINVPGFIWAIGSGVILIQFIGTFSKLISEYAIREKKTNQNLKIFLLSTLFFTLFIVGIVLNSIKGLAIYALTFLDFQDGELITRTDFSTMPSFDIPFVVKTGLFVACLLHSAVLWLVYSKSSSTS